MSKILVINDVHIADRPPLGRRDGYCDQILAKLEECRRLACDQRWCEITLFTGDLFHTKRPSHVSHALVQRLITMFREWPGRRFAILGNHDCSEAGLESVNRQPIGVLFRAGALEYLADDIILNVAGRRIQISPAHYDANERPERYSLRRKYGVEIAIKVAHGMILPPNSKAPFEFVPADTIDTNGMNFCFYGHPHDDHGEYSVGGARFVNFGSLARVARTPDNWQRSVYVAILDVDTKKVERVELKSVCPSDDVFLTPETISATMNEDVRAYAQTLVDALQQGTGMSLEALFAETTRGTSEEVKQLVLRYLHDAGL